MSIRGWLSSVRGFLIPDHKASVPLDVVAEAARKMEAAAATMNRRVDEIAAHPHPLDELMRRMARPQQPPV